MHEVDNPYGIKDYLEFVIEDGQCPYREAYKMLHGEIYTGYKVDNQIIKDGNHCYILDRRFWRIDGVEVPIYD